MDEQKYKYDLDEHLERGTPIDGGAIIAVVVAVVGIICLLIWG